MNYRATFPSSGETVGDVELSAWQRLDDALALYSQDRYHGAIYIAGFAAEMLLKTAAFYLGGATSTQSAQTMRDQVKQEVSSGILPATGAYESGHGLGYWSEVIIYRRNRQGLPPPPIEFVPIVTSLHLNWFVGMRYFPGSATEDDAAQFITQVEWLARSHAAVRS